LQEKSPFEKGGFRGFENLHGKEFMANAIKDFFFHSERSTESLF
jgi:hypothetical protein